MPSPFKQIAEEKKAENEQVTQKIEQAHKPQGKFTKDFIRDWIKAGSKSRKSSICAMLIGNPKIGKSGVLLDIRSEEEKAQGKKLIVFERSIHGQVEGWVTLTGGATASTHSESAI